MMTLTKAERNNALKYTSGAKYVLPMDILVY